MNNWHDDKQKFFTPFGYGSLRGKCENSSFTGGPHRVGMFPIEYIEDGLSGYTVKRRCVNCGKWIGNIMFKPMERSEKIDKCIESNGRKLGE